MKILAEETIVRYHVEFDEEETNLLKACGFLPPYAEPCARLWSTKTEIENTEAVLAHMRAELATARALLAKAKRATAPANAEDEP